ncbi:MAG TPA: FAD-binding protein [Polyangiaceae bacterium]|nr:FAD-binding protein [Polyangiaceae bacterium]
MVSRRAVLMGLGAAALVTGFDPVTRSWISAAHAATIDHVPDLDGELWTDPSSLAPYADDVGKIIHQTPVAVLRPGSARDIQKMVRFCRKRRIKIAARGQGHSTFGQSQVAGGLVIDMASLNKIHSLGPCTAEVDGGATWKQLVNASVPLGYTPPALTGYINLSIGGTLSMGGVSSTNAQGAQVDNVRELEVVTGEGELVRCSSSCNTQLFEAVLAGVGQCGIITRATVEVVPAKPQSRVFLLNYTDNATFFNDFRTLLNRGEFDGLYNIWVPGDSGGLVYQLNAIKHFDPAHPPDDASLLRGLHYDRATSTSSDSSYLDQVQSVDVIIDFLRSIGLFDAVIHPWFDVFLPDAKVEQYVADVLPTLTPEDVGPTGFMLLFALKRSKLKRPLLRVPERGDYVYLFDILTSSSVPGDPDPAFVSRMLARNRRLFEKARDLGGTRYPIGSLEFSRSDWERQYGNQWDDFKRAKRRFDPDALLAPNLGIFT